MICFDHVSFAYEKNVPVLSDISFTVKEGENVGLIGANGAGKSTVMKLILGLLKGEGTVTVSGIPVRNDTLSEIRKRCGFVMQNSDQQMFMPTVCEDLLFGPLNYGYSKEEAQQEADRVTEMLHIAHLKNKYNHKISGGEKRMAAIASVLVMRPDVLLLDEPTSTLDPFNRRMVINVMKELPQTKIITSHDLDMILDTCDRVILIGNGKIQADGPCRQILTDKKLLEDNRLELPLCLAGVI